MKWQRLAACILAGSMALGSNTVLEARHGADMTSTTVVSTERRAQAASLSTPQETSAAPAASRHGALPTASSSLGRSAAGSTPALSGVAASAARVGTDQPMHLWPVEAVDVGGTLLFSDSPEYVKTPGILYSDTVKGDARILFYHLNDSQVPRKVAVVLENTSDQYAIVHITRGGMSQPSSDYLEVGRNTQIAYFDTKLNEVLYIGSGGRRLLQEKMETTTLQPGQLVYGVYDFSSSVPVKVSVIMYPAADNPYDFIQTASVLPKDEQRLRGTFTGMDRIISSTRPYNPDRDGIVYIPIGDNHIDAYRTGIDATDGSSVVNYGNYGVLYRIEIPTIGRRSSQYYLSPLGGTYTGAMRVEMGQTGTSKLILTPDGEPFFGDKSTVGGAAAGKDGMAFLTVGTELANLGTYSSSSRLSFEYSPPGASNLPVRLILVPTDSPALAQTPKKR